MDMIKMAVNDTHQSFMNFDKTNLKWSNCQCLVYSCWGGKKCSCELLTAKQVHSRWRPWLECPASIQKWGNCRHTWGLLNRIWIIYFQNCIYEPSYFKVTMIINWNILFCKVSNWKFYNVINLEVIVNLFLTKEWGTCFIF